MNFGEYPIHIVERAEGGYAVESADQEIAEECGVTPVFEADRLEVMKARAYAHGYALVLPGQEGVNE